MLQSRLHRMPTLEESLDVLRVHTVERCRPQNASIKVLPFGSTESATCQQVSTSKSNKKKVIRQYPCPSRSPLTAGPTELRTHDANSLFVLSFQRKAARSVVRHTTRYLPKNPSGFRKLQEYNGTDCMSSVFYSGRRASVGPHLS
ncbi:unnamed protein product [Ectocarpus fasciculatus]